MHACRLANLNSAHDPLANLGPVPRPLVGLHVAKNRDLCRKMTIQMKLDLPHVQSLPTLGTEAHWVVEDMPEDDLSNPANLGKLNRLKLQYTSLRDLIAESPTKRGSPRVQESVWCDLSQMKFKDRLLKQAARAYLLPIGVETSQEMHFFARCWKSLTNNKALGASIKESLKTQVQACADFFRTHVYSRLSYAFDRLIQLCKLQLFGFLRVRPKT